MSWLNTWISEILDGVVCEGAVARAQERVHAVLRVVGQLPGEVGAHGAAEVDGAGAAEHLAPLRPADRLRGVEDLVRPLPGHAHYPVLVIQWQKISVSKWRIFRYQY